MNVVLRFWRGLAVYRTLVATGLGAWATSLAAATYLCRTSDLPLSLVLFHAPLALGWISVSLMGPSLVFRGRCAQTGSRWAQAMVTTTGLVALLALYTIDLTVAVWWGTRLNFKIAMDYLAHPVALLDVLGLSVPTLLEIAFAVGGVFLAIFAVSPRLLEGSRALISTIRALARAWPRPAGLLMGLSFGCGLLMVAPAWRAGVARQDPFVSFVLPTDRLLDMGMSSLVASLRESEPVLRAQYPRSATFDRKNVFVITLDSARPDHMQAYGYNRETTPFLHRLQSQGALRRVDLATSTCAETSCGIRSTLSSKPLRELVPEAFELPDLLADQGYATYVMLSGAHNALYGRSERYRKEATMFLDSTDTNLAIADDEVIEQGLARVPAFSGQPAFFYFHLMSTHFLGIRNPNFAKWQPAKVSQDWQALARRQFDDARIRNNHDNGILQADDFIRRIFDRLGAKGYLDNSVGIILADHGDGLGDEGNGRRFYGHISRLIPEFINIPFLIYDPSAQVYPDLSYASQVDVAPTLAARLGLTVPESWRGRSLLGPAPNVRYTFHQTRLLDPMYAVIRATAAATYKYVYHPRSKGEWVYDLRNDPGETRDMKGALHAGELEDFRSVLGASLKNP